MTNNLVEKDNPDSLLTLLIDALADCPTVERRNIKARLTVHHAYAVGAGHPDGMAHLTVSVLDGRPDEVLAVFRDRMGAALQKAFADSRSTDSVGLTCEIRLMLRQWYFREG